jgi:16S rRNA G966 N2-methylase RsmD
MSFRCPNCGSSSCVVAAEHVLEIAPTMYVKCEACRDLVLQKTDKIDLSKISFADATCTKCGRRPLDAVMAHILAISVRRRERPALSLREVGTPLLSPGIPTYTPPHIGCHNLLLMTNQRLVADASDRIFEEVPEVTGVIFGDLTKVIGLAHQNAQPHTCRVLAGCDMRADLITSAYGELLIYKSQSKIHIEHNNAVKMAKLGSLPVAGRVVLDALAGPGSLGLMSVLMGAQKVILNDAWLPAVKNAYLNLQVNRNILGIRTIKRTSVTERESDTAPELFCTAVAEKSIIELYHGDFHEFDIQDSQVDIILVDPFPGTERHFTTLRDELHKKHLNVQLAYF